MRSWYYILNERGEPTPVADLFTWGHWFETADRVVARHTIHGLTVSTVFLGIDHSFDDTKMPVLWETMIFGADEKFTDERLKGLQWRYTSREEAIGGHQLVLEMVRETHALESRK